jgi:hypothetical protein
MKFRFIDVAKESFPVTRLCQVAPACMAYALLKAQ